MTDAEKAAAYDDLMAKIREALIAAGYGTPRFRTSADLLAGLNGAYAALTTLPVGERIPGALPYIEHALALDATEPEPEPPPPPPTGEWRTLIDLSRMGSWKNRLISAPGASITEGTFQGKQAIRIQKPRPGTRCELHHMQDDLTARSEYRYSWYLWIPASVDLTTDEDWTCCQQHGDDTLDPEERGAGYTGGLKLTDDDGIIVSVKGGKVLSFEGAHRYEYELNGKGEGAVTGPDRFGTIRRDRWHRVTYHAKWSEKWDGFVRCQLDDGPVLVIEDVPTASAVSMLQMFRLGWYSGSEDHGPLDMYVADAKIEVPA